jgi:hypothetical protein
MDSDIVQRGGKKLPARNFTMQQLGTALMAALIGGLVVLISSSREHDAKMVEIAVGVLRAQPTEDISGARRWAIRVINKSSVPLEKAEEEDLLKHALPYVPSADFSDPRNSQYVPLLHP